MQGSRRRHQLFRSLIADRKSQFQWAATSALAIVLPGSLAVVFAFARLALGTAILRDQGSSPGELSRYVVSYCWTAGLTLTLAFAVLGAFAFFIGLRISARVIGPVKRLESQVENMIEGRSAPPTVLRKGDYLQRLAALLDALSRLSSARSAKPAPKTEDSGKA
jgi:hypothetical protein